MCFSGEFPVAWGLKFRLSFSKLVCICVPEVVPSGMVAYDNSALRRLMYQ
jgi:hypothetical protein